MTDPHARRAGLRRAAQLLGGLVLYAASIVLLVRAELGSMPWDVLSQGVVRVTGWSFGTVTVVLSFVVFACWVPLRQRPGIGTVANVVVIGALLDPFLALAARLPDPLPLPAAIGLVVLGVLTNALATSLYVGARLGPGPRDGLMTGIVARTGWPLRLVRGSIEVVVVAVGWALGGTLGFGTLAYALAIGPLVHALLPRLSVPERPAAAADGAGTPGAAGVPAVDGAAEPDVGGPVQPDAGGAVEPVGR
ncbi:YitT family protein [Cellulomonas sp. NPDC057328]|uniref:membrane protein YczE n=1 Tax=Cellulomonas sp. NPDC057328 TaxID=3346101 RepID=UPI00362F92F5